MNTEYAVLSTQDLVVYAQKRDNRTSLEYELAMRLEVAEAMIREMVKEDEPPLRLVL